VTGGAQEATAARLSFTGFPGDFTPTSTNY
jgi:hypothetical protein